MKHRKRIKFKIWVWCSIALFLLIPLLNSPVAAALNCTGMSVTTTAGPAGTPISITVTNPTSLTFTDDGTGAINFICNYSFSDAFTTTRTPSSRHKSSLTVTIKTGTGTGGFSGTNWVILNNGQSSSGTLTVPATYTSPPTVFNVILDTHVQEFPFGAAGDKQYTRNWEVTVNP